VLAFAEGGATSVSAQIPGPNSAGRAKTESSVLMIAGSQNPQNMRLNAATCKCRSTFYNRSRLRRKYRKHRVSSGFRNAEVEGSTPFRSIFKGILISLSFVIATDGSNCVESHLTFDELKQRTAQPFFAKL